MTNFSVIEVEKKEQCIIFDVQTDKKRCEHYILIQIEAAKLKSNLRPTIHKDLVSITNAMQLFAHIKTL